MRTIPGHSHSRRRPPPTPPLAPPPAPPPTRLVVGISGASGIVYGLRLLATLHHLGVETHLVMSRTAEVILAQETTATLAGVRRLATVWYPVIDLAAAIASGSFRTLGMIIAPCSVRTMSEIATGITQSLLTRAADVTLKERRPLVLMIRETPLHLGHLRTMAALAEMGAVIAPPVPAFYSHPQSIDDIVDHTVGRALDLFGIDTGRVVRWQGPVDEPGGAETPEDASVEDDVSSGDAMDTDAVAVR